MSLSLMYDGTKMEKSFTVNSYSYGELGHKSRYFINIEKICTYICLNYKLCTDDACDSDCVKAKVTSNTDGWEGVMHKCMKMQSHLTPGLF